MQPRVSALAIVAAQYRVPMTSCAIHGCAQARQVSSGATSVSVAVAGLCGVTPVGDMSSLPNRFSRSNGMDAEDRR
jgi:hypothetical protein